MGHLSWIVGAFSADGSLLALAQKSYYGCGPGLSFQFHMIDMGTFTAQRTWQEVNAAEIRQDNLVFNPSGTLFVTTSDNVIHVWDTKTARQLAILQNNTGTVRHVIFSPDGTTLLSQGDDGTIRSWRVNGLGKS